MALDLDGIVNLVVVGLTTHVFGNINITTSAIIVFFLLFSLLIKIPLPLALTIPLPLIVVFVAYGFMPLAIGALVAVGFIVLSAGAFLKGLGIK